jgi:hypothetical protein
MWNERDVPKLHSLGPALTRRLENPTTDESTSDDVSVYSYYSHSWAHNCGGVSPTVVDK